MKGTPMVADRYILVKVRDASATFPEKPVVFEDGLVYPESNFAKIRKAIHAKSKEQFISVADICSHSVYMTENETQQLENIFNQVMARAKAYRKGK